MAEKKRIVWIDQLRGLAFYFVVLGHMLANSDFKVWIYSFHMPLFFIISGFNLNLTKMYKTSFKDYISHLASRMLVPYLWLQLIGLGIKYLTFFLDKGKEVRVSGYLLGIIAGNSFVKSAPSNAMYFVLLLFLSQVIMFVLVKLTKANKGLIFAIVFALTAISIYSEGKGVVWHANVVPTAMLLLLVGRFFMDCYTSLSDNLRKIKLPVYIAVCAVMIALGAVLAIDNGRASIHGNYFGEQYTVFVISAVLTSVAFALLVMLIPSTKLFNLIGMNTIFFLGIHEPFLVAVQTIFTEHWKKGWFAAIASVVCYFLPIPIAWLLNRVAPYICGMAVKENTLPIRITKFIMVAIALAAPYARFTATFLDGALRETVTMQIVSVGIFILLVVGIERLFSLLLPVFFLQNKKEQEVSKTNKPDVYEDDNIIIIMPVEEV